MVDDEVWASIDPTTGRLRRRTVRVIVGAAVALVALGLGAETLQRYGAFAPQVVRSELGWDATFTLADGTKVAALNVQASPNASTRVTLHNVGRADEWIHSITVAGAGIAYVGNRVGEVHQTGPNAWAAGGRPLSPGEPYRLAPGAEEQFEIEFVITDCAVVGDPPIVVTVESWRGVRTVELTMTRVRHVDGGWSVTAADDPLGVGGFRYLADKVCARP